MKKQCSRCLLIKDISFFIKNNNKPYGYGYHCKMCESSRKSIYNKNRRIKNKEYIKNKEKEYYYKNRKKSEQRHRENPEIKRKVWREYSKYKSNTDILFRLRKNLRTRLYQSLTDSRYSKNKKTMCYVGCSLVYLKSHLESLFTVGMNWNNYGKWHIDHIMPMSKFDLTKDEEIFKAMHYTNLQPLWAIENLKKGNRN